MGEDKRTDVEKMMHDANAAGSEENRRALARAFAPSNAETQAPTHTELAPSRPREVPAGVIDFGKVMRARRAAEAEEKRLEDADELLAKMQSQLHRMQTMLVALTKRDGRIRLTRSEIEGVTKSDKLAMRIDQETGAVTLEVMT